MWEHTIGLIGVPGAIKAVWDLVDRLSDDPQGMHSKAEARRELGAMRSAIEAFAEDARVLAAYKALHAMTNQLPTDLMEAFAMSPTSSELARVHYNANHNAIKGEFIRMRGQAGAVSQLEAMRRNADHMGSIAVTKALVKMQRRPDKPWDEHYYDLIARAEKECVNFNNFFRAITELRVYNDALNVYADNILQVGITEFDQQMARLREALANTQ